MVAAHEAHQRAKEFHDAGPATRKVLDAIKVAADRGLFTINYDMTQSAAVKVRLELLGYTVKQHKQAYGNEAWWEISW